MFTQVFQRDGSPPMRDPKFKDRGEPLDGRTVQYAHSVEGIDEVYQTFTRYDHMDRYTLGDIIGPVIFHPRSSDETTLKPPSKGESVVPSPVPPEPRPIPAWSYAMPVIGAETTDGSIKAFPIYDKFYSVDDRFEPYSDFDYSMPPGSSLAAGQIGIMIGATKEDGLSENLLLPTGDRALVAVNNKFSEPKMSSIVYDLKDGTEEETSSALSDIDKAPLHTFWQVMRPKVKYLTELDSEGRTRKRPEPILAWHVGKPEYSPIAHGACIDKETPLEKTSEDPITIMGFAGWRLGGPLLCGTHSKEKHLIGYTPEGEPQFSMHLDTLTLFKRHDPLTGIDFDAPIMFEGEYRKDHPLPHNTRAHIRYDPCLKHPWLGETREGFWRVQVETDTAGSEDVPPEGSDGGSGSDTGTGGGGGSLGTSLGDYFDIIPSPDTTEEEPPLSGDDDKEKPEPPSCYDLLDANWQIAAESGTIPINKKYHNDRSDYSGQNSYRYSAFPFAFPEIIGKPHNSTLGTPDIKDYKYSTLPRVLPLISQYQNEMPITAKILFFGGVNGFPNYTQESGDITGRYKSGTGDGGLFICPPELDAVDIRLQNETGGHAPEVTNNETSSTSFGLAPKVKMFWGYYDSATGGIYSDSTAKAWSVHAETSNALKFDEHTSGTATTQLTFPHTGSDFFEFNKTIQSNSDIKFKSGTNFTASFEHNISTDQTFTFPDATGTVALTSDIYWDRTGTTLSPTNSGDNVDDVGTLTATNVTAENQLKSEGDIVITGGTVNQVTIEATPTGNRTLTLPDETGQVKLKKDKVAWFSATGIVMDAYSSYGVVNATTSAGRSATVTGICPNDFSSLTSMVVTIISSATDASVDIDLVSEYGSNGEDHATHTASSTGTTYNLTAGRITEISISSLYASLVAGDYIGLSITNNDATTTIHVMGVKMVYTPTN